MGLNQTSTVRVVQKRFTEVFEGRFVDHVRFESESQVFDLVLAGDRWMISVVDGTASKLPDYANSRRSSSADDDQPESTEDISI
ncbi:hypothetical protein LCGC14_2006320 [marine sediment metagenome]|uniref:Uncharacterized protein n=1 Tax=marine sediment metagenome TaxID=412755 RepID=A0A0F9FPD0_9ZZZZ